MVRRIVGILYLFIVATCILSAQNPERKITGVVRAVDGRPIVSAMCRLLNAQDSLLSFVQTKGDGRYEFVQKDGAKCIEIALWGYETHKFNLQTNISHYEITLHRNAKNIHEVVVTATPISRNSDTLNYRVDAFREKSDRTISDVLKRMPGIEVKPSGEIHYQGVPINHVNIEGQNMMGSRYNLATETMPAEAVSQIQVMERNQPIRALEGKQRSDRATLNIKLKENYRLRPFGEIGLHGGASPFLWDNNLTTFFFGKKHQLLAMGAMNNTGRNLRTLSQGLGTALDTESEPLPQRMLSVSSPMRPPLATSYYWNNHSHLASLNYLRGYSHEKSLRANMTYQHGRVVQDDSAYYHYAIGADTVSYFQRTASLQRVHSLAGSIAFVNNSPKVYLQEVMSGTGEWERYENLSYTHQGRLHESMQTSPFTLSNILRATLNVGNMAYDVSSNVRWVSETEQLYLNSTFSQYLRKRNFFMAHSIGTDWSIGRMIMHTAYGLKFKNTHLMPRMGGVNYKSRYWQQSLDFSADMPLGGGTMSIAVPVAYLSYHYNYRPQSNRCFLWSPELSWSKNWNVNVHSLFTFSHNKAGNTSDLLIPTLLRQTYRVFYQSLDSLSVSRTTMGSMRWSFINLANMFSWNFYASWSHTKCDSYFSAYYSPNTTYATPVWEDSRRTTLSFQLSFQKVNRKSGLTLSQRNSFARSKRFVSQNNLRGDIHYNAWNMSWTLQWAKLKWLTADLTAEGNLSWKDIDVFSSTHNVLKNVYYQLTLRAYPLERMQCNFTFSQSTQELTHGHYATNCFVNLGAEYTLNGRLTVDFRASNLLHRKTYEEVRYNGANFTYYALPLRGREVLFGLRYKF